MESVSAPSGMPLPPFTVRSLSERWGCSEGSVRSLIRTGKIDHFRIGELIRIPAAVVWRFECQA